MHHAMSIMSGLESSLLFAILRRKGESGGCGAMGCFLFIIGLGLVLYFVMKGKADRREQLGASRRPLTSGPISSATFACPFSKCDNCGASGDKMKQQWDGLRKVTWTCGYCGNIQAQELKDEELPLSARQRLGLDQDRSLYDDDGRGPSAGLGGGLGGNSGGMGGMLTGMMIGSMLGGGNGLGGGRGNGSSGDSGSEDGSGNGSDWGEDSGGDSGSDWGDSGGDSGGDDW